MMRTVYFVLYGFRFILSVNINFYLNTGSRGFFRDIVLFIEGRILIFNALD
jgi:hypothetical protein